METQKNMAELLITESNRFDNFVYCSKPYSCGLQEALNTFKDFKVPKNMDIVREEKRTTITLNPLKGTRKRKPYVIVLWV